MRRALGLVLLALLALVRPARAADATPGYPERVLQWTVKNDETCDDIALALYGATKHRALVARYNAVDCAAKRPLGNGLTLVVPAEVTDLPTARLRSLHPDVRARPPGGSWSPAAPGMALYKNHSVNTLDKARADILFVDRTRVVLAEHTLVVIYGTAKQTAVSKTPPAVELERGEVQAGLAALRGKPVEIAAHDGRISVRSRESAVRATTKRATVSVFDGSASVSSAGKKVEVPLNHGTVFEKAKPPEPPRPLPPAPKWIATAPAVLLAAPGRTRIGASWEAVPKAVKYRLELARDADFSELVAREEAPAEVRAFRGENLPPGSYWLRVRAIDSDDFLGIASEAKNVNLAEARFEGTNGTVESGVIEASPYGSLAFTGFEALEVSIDGGPFGKLPARVDLLALAPKNLAFRLRGETDATRYDLRYIEPTVTIAARPRDGDALDVRVRLGGLAGVDVSNRVAPSLRVRQGAKLVRAPLAREGDAFVAHVGALDPGPAELEVIDSRGRVIGRTAASLGERAQAPRASPRRPRLGPSAPLLPPSPAADVGWWAPTPDTAASLSALGYVEKGHFGEQLAARASGTVGALGFDATIATPELEGQPADGSAWLGLRWRPLRAGRIELGPALQLGLPLTRTSPPPRAGLGFALAGYGGPLTWVVDAGGRAALEDDASRRSAPDAQAFLLAGATYDLRSWLRAYALCDAHALVSSEKDLFGRGGFTLGLEAGTRLFGGFALRASPWDDTGGHAMGQISLGVRER